MRVDTGRFGGKIVFKLAQSHIPFEWSQSCSTEGSVLVFEKRMKLNSSCRSYYDKKSTSLNAQHHPENNFCLLKRRLRQQKPSSGFPVYWLMHACVLLVRNRHQIRIVEVNIAKSSLGR